MSCVHDFSTLGNVLPARMVGVGLPRMMTVNSPVVIFLKFCKAVGMIGPWTSVLFFKPARFSMRLKKK